MNNTGMEAGARERLHRRVLVELDERGRDGVDLTRVLERAAVSEADFAASYDDLDQCIFAAYEELTARLDEAVRTACRAGGRDGEWPARVRRGLEALLHELAAEPQLARVLLRAFPAIGPRAQARSQAFVESFSPMLSPGRELAPEGTELPAEVETLASGAVEAIVFEEIVSGRTRGLPRLLPSLVFSLLVPFVGPARARDEMVRAQR